LAESRHEQANPEHHRCRWGPAGLYLAILVKNRPDLAVSILERNTPQDAYGFGVVISDETLDHLQEADEPSYGAMTESFRHWRDIEVRHPDGTELVSGGHSFAAISRRALLEILTGRARELGAVLRFSTEVGNGSLLQKADAIVGADGANSTVRRAMENELQPRVVQERNKYIWFGTPRVFDEFNFIFEDTPSGTGVRRLAPRRGRTGGDGWWMALAERRDIDLYQADGSHPSVAGSYLAAVVIAAVILDVDPESFDASLGLDEGSAEALRGFGARAVSGEVPWEG
jgi:2-polyprenyl-6-methoxyphenol hydroxylase-like FAD-dependent oxidoreductase